MIKELNSLKAILALLVFLCHTMGLPGLGGLAVSLFFILSGFGLSSGYLGSVQSRSFNVRNFYKRRLLKIWPLHIIFFVLAVLLRIYRGDVLSPVSLVLNALLLQSWIPEASVYYSCNPISWFLSVLVFCYLVFPVLARLITKNRPIFYLAFALYGVCIMSFAHIMAGKSLEYAFFICPLTRVIDFILGMILYDLFKSGALSVERIIPSKKLGISTVAVLLLVIVVSIFIPWAYSRYSIAFMVAGCTILALLLSTVKEGSIPILSNSFICSLGKYSFPFYICHGVCIDFCKLFLDEGSMIFVALSFAISVFLAFAVSKLRFIKN